MSRVLDIFFFFFQMASDKMQGNSLKSHCGRFRLVIRKKFFMERGGQTLEQVAWRSVGVAIPGGILESSLRGGCGEKGWNTLL